MALSPSFRLTSSAVASWLQERLDRAALVHRGVAVRYLVERQHEVEDFAGIDRALQNEVDEGRQGAPHRRRPAVKTHVREEQGGAIDRHIVRHADKADRTAGP